MRLLFLLLMISNFTVVWFAFQQPAPNQETYALINLPRVSHLQLLSEVPVQAGPEESEEPLSIAESPVGVASDPDSADWTEFDLGRLSQPLLSDLFRVPDDGGVPFLVDNLDPIEPSPTQCFVISGFGDREQAEQWLAQVEESFGMEGESAGRQVAREPLHWVIIPPGQTRAERIRLFRELQRNGIDSYLVTQGDQANAISLGLFESRRAAESVLRRRRQAGIEAILTEYPRVREEFFVAVLTDEPRLLAESVPENVKAAMESDACGVLH